uniref:Midkine n=1 Tax=Cebus imitator TaxID=2715852 RepID=A0A2K5R5W6_CEBIM
VQHRGFLLLSLLALLALTSAVAKKKDKAKKDGPGSECAEEWSWGPCSRSSKDCCTKAKKGKGKDERPSLDAEEPLVLTGAWPMPSLSLPRDI